MIIGSAKVVGSADICSHRWGADMTFSFNTDAVLVPSYFNVEYLAFLHNMRLGCFAASFINQTSIVGSAETGAIKHGHYTYTDRWASGGSFPLIPDYNEPAWTAAGVATFANAVLGQPKTVREPNHGQQLYDISGGIYGYDRVSESLGSNNLQELKGLIDNQQFWLNGQVGGNDRNGAYRNGKNNSPVTFMEEYLSVRNSDPLLDITALNTQYGSGLGSPVAEFDRLFFMDYPSTLRYHDATEPNKQALYEAALTQCLADKGWFRNFTHWHSAHGGITAIADFIQTTKAHLAADNVWYCSNSEAVEYMVAREVSEAVQVLEIGSTLTVGVLTYDRFANEEYFGINGKLPDNSLHTPVSIEIDTTGTVLAGQSIVSDYGKILPLSSNKFVVEVPVDGFSKVTLSAGTGGYHVTAAPSVVTYSGGNLVVSEPCNCVLFQTTNGTFDIAIRERSNTMATNHTFTQTGDKIGLINEFGQMSLHSV